MNQELVVKSMEAHPCLINTSTAVEETYEPVHEKTNNLCFRPGLTQTGAG